MSGINPYEHLIETDEGESVIESFKNSYFRTLAIFDHIRELNLLYDQYKTQDNALNYKTKIRKELIDLYILIDLEFELRNPGYEELYITRLEKFKDKIRR